MAGVKGYVLAAGIFSIVVVSTAAVVFPLITIADPMMKGGWRIQLTFAGFSCIALYRFNSHLEKYKNFIKNYKSGTTNSGIFLALYFSLWCASLDLTSIAHSLLISCSSSMILVFYYLIIGRSIKFKEVAGSVLAFIGIFIMCLGYDESENTSFIGDSLAFLSAVSLAIHLNLSEDLYEQGDFFYLGLVYLVGSVACLVFSVVYNMIIEGPSGFWVILKNFDYFTSSEGLYVLYLGLFTGVIAGVAFYYFLSRASALAVSVLLLFEPILGTFYSFMLNFQPFPSLYTCIGGVLVLFGNIQVNIISKFPSSSTAPLLSNPNSN